MPHRSLKLQKIASVLFRTARRNPCDKLSFAKSGDRMQTYFFDVHDGMQRFEDQAGISLKGMEEVPAEAESLLRLLAYEHINGAKPIVIKATVRDGSGQKVFRATIEAGHGGVIFTGV